MTNSSPPPDPSQSSQPKKPMLSFDEKVAIIVAFTAIGIILFWSWEGSKGKLFSQTWQKLKSTVEKTAVLETDTTESFDAILSIDSEAEETGTEETDVATLPETRPQPEQTTDSKFSQTDILTSRKRRISVGVERKPIIVLPTLPTAPSPPKTVETPPLPTAPSPPKTVETPTVETPIKPTVTFDDVPSDYWAYPFIEPLIAKEFIVGISDNKFQPDLPITRAQLATEIETAFKQETSQDLINFEDVSEESRVANKIDEAVKTGFLKGYPGQVFLPDRQVPRLQVLVALVSGLGLQASKDPATILSAYQDADQIPDWAKEKIAIAIESGLVVNRPEFSSQLLYPNESATRAEVIAMIYQGLVKAGRVEPISSPYIISSP